MATLSNYPHAPGYKTAEVETSIGAAIEITDRAGTLRKKAYESLRTSPKTADEVAAALGESILSIRPRISELVAQGLVKASANRRRNSSGKSAVVWQINLNQFSPLTQSTFDL